MNLYLHVELQDQDSIGEWGSSVDVYGYENAVVVWSVDFIKTYPTNNLKETLAQMDYVVNKLKDANFKVIYREDKINA